MVVVVVGAAVVVVGGIVVVGGAAVVVVTGGAAVVDVEVELEVEGWFCPVCTVVSGLCASLVGGDELVPAVVGTAAPVDACATEEVTATLVVVVDSVNARFGIDEVLDDVVEVGDAAPSRIVVEDVPANAMVFGGWVALSCSSAAASCRAA